MRLLWAVSSSNWYQVERDGACRKAMMKSARRLDLCLRQKRGALTEAVHMRDTRIDIIRGFAMVTIIINHFSLLASRLGLQGPQIPTTTTVSISSAAAIFVALSGYMVGMVYTKKVGAGWLLLLRAGKLYAWNFALFLAAALFTLIAGHAYNSVLRLTPIVETPYQAFLYFAILAYGPFLLDILHLYIILLLVSPLAIWLLRRSPLLLIVLSVLIYCAFHVGLRLAPDIGGSPNPLEADRWRFHPVAWQLMFFVPMAAGNAKLHERAFQLLEVRPQIFWASFAIFAVIGVVINMPEAPHIVLADRGTLGPIRFAHALLVLVVYAGLITLLREYLSNPSLQALAVIGRHSLNVFLLSTVLTFVATYVWQQWLLGWVGYVALTVCLLVLVWVAANYWDMRKVSRTKPSALSNRAL
jgi:hypothetical protein